MKRWKRRSLGTVVCKPPGKDGPYLIFFLYVFLWKWHLEQLFTRFALRRIFFKHCVYTIDAILRVTLFLSDEWRVSFGNGLHGMEEVREIVKGKFSLEKLDQSDSEAPNIASSTIGILKPLRRHIRNGASKCFLCLLRIKLKH